MNDVLTLLWTRGDAWLDFTEMIRLRPVTLITGNGTSRIPLGDADAMTNDFDRQMLSSIEFGSPCGVPTLAQSAVERHATTPVLAVLDGIHPSLAATKAGRHLVHRGRGARSALDHPAVVCPVYYCHKKESL
jgi:hypothetical protein